MIIPITSGKIYISEYAGTMPEDTALEISAKLLGAIKDGAEFSYTPTYYRAVDDSGAYSRQVLTEEQVKLKTKLIAYGSNIFGFLSPTAEVTTVAATSSVAGSDTITLGGVSNQNGKKYVVRFVADDPGEGISKITIIGINTLGIKFAMKNNDASAIEAEFEAMPKSDGSLVEIKWTIPATGD